MATTEDVADDLPFDVGRLPVPIGEQATDAAMDVLEEAQPEQRPTVNRIRRVCAGELPAHAASSTDWVRTLKHAAGHLVAVTWSSTGVTQVGYDADTNQYIVAGFTAIGDDDVEFTDTAGSETAKDILNGSPQAIALDESELIEGGELA